ncbi:MAG: HAD family hydrolase [Desulfuromonadales bacterium]|nr:HAD family hydrolase [Desulfuromonadales bacterium]
MVVADPQQIRSIIFDLDGTLYVSPEVAHQIEAIGDELAAATRGVSLEEGRALLRGARRRLAETYEEEPTLSRTLMEMGIEISDFHRAMQEKVTPERFLQHDPVLFALLDSLRDNCELYIYTNNNLPLARKILALLGVEELFSRLYTIEFGWQPKPDQNVLERILEDIGGPRESFLFVGDRHNIDLRLADSFGIPTLLVSETADLLQIHKVLGILP